MYTYGKQRTISETIKEWVKIDNEIRVLQQQQLIRKKEKKAISDSLIDVMKKNEIDCFDINDEQIIYNKKKRKKPYKKKKIKKK